jgi:hypothetical protein
VIIGGRFVIKDRSPLIDADEIYSNARAASEKLWKKLA